MFKVFSLLIVIAAHSAFAQDTLKVLFVYGSKPMAKGEKKLFGGIHGGHVSLQYKDAFASFIRKGSLHIFPRKEKHSGIMIEKDMNFRLDTSVSKYLIIDVPINSTQAMALDSIITSRLDAPTYDYAFCGFRCASSAYEMMASAGIYKHYSNRKIKLKYFYPKLLRKRMLKEARKKHWKIIYREGSKMRKWEKD